MQEKIDMQKWSVFEIRLQFEYTARGTPQRNGRIERKFATFYGRIRACYTAAIQQLD